MNNDVICLYYSRTGRTRRTMEEIAAALGCEALPVRDRVRRRGAIGWLRCGLDAMRRHTSALARLETPRPLSDYRLVVLGTPIWAGRCSSVIRGLLKRRGYEMNRVAYVLTHDSEELYKDVYRQMDQYLLVPHVAEVSLRPGGTGYEHWRDLFVKQCMDFVSEK